jgi:hypothetical protein
MTYKARRRWKKTEGALKVTLLSELNRKDLSKRRSAGSLCLNEDWTRGMGKQNIQYYARNMKRIHEL